MRSGILSFCCTALWFFCLSSPCLSAPLFHEHAPGHIKIHLTPHALRGVHLFPYNNIIVLDNRLDTGRFGATDEGTILEFNQPAGAAIGSYIEASTSAYPKKEMTLVVNIKRLDCSRQIYEAGILPGITLSADAYYSLDGHAFFLLKKSTLQTTYVKCNSLSKIVRGMIDHFISSAISAVRKNNDTLTMALINQPPGSDWAGYPINSHLAMPTSGYYMDFASFKNDLIIHRSFHMQLETDSTYRVIFPADTYYRYMPEPEIWALRDSSGSLYIHLGSYIYLPMERWNNSFRFQIPGGLAQHLYVIPVAISREIQASSARFATPSETYGGEVDRGFHPSLPEFNSNLNGASFAGILLFVGAVITLEGTVYILKGIVKSHQGKNQQDKLQQDKKNKPPGSASTRTRGLFLAMDTGDIIYL